MWDEIKDDIKDKLVLLLEQNQTRIDYDKASCINLSSICLALGSHFFLHRSTFEFGNNILSLSFTILLVICWFLRLFLVQKPKKMVQLYNCMVLNDKD
jgi:hypothetical protein